MLNHEICAYSIILNKEKLTSIVAERLPLSDNRGEFSLFNVHKHAPISKIRVVIYHYFWIYDITAL